jgi:threonine aldolase
MRQAGYLAAAGLYALDNHVERLHDDHRAAKAVEQQLQSLPYIAGVLPVETNIVIFKLADTASPEKFLSYLLEKNIRAFSIAPHTIRFVFHLDVGPQQVDALLGALKAFR